MNKPFTPPVDFNHPDFDENREWTEEDFARARPASEVHPPHVVRALVRGPQHAPTKKQVTLRLDPEVIDKFRATGRGWQARMNDALKAAKV
jgi:uncharacterized protein (DUF4415 family)